MESIDYFDEFLDPPEYPTHLSCDSCNEIFDNNDLSEIGSIWLCDNCLERKKIEKGYKMNSLETENFNILKIYNSNKKFIRIEGWSWKSAYYLIKKIESINGNKPAKIICDEWSFIFMFENKNKFGYYDVIIDDYFIQNSCKDFGIKENEHYIVISPYNYDQVYGIIYLDKSK
jgi:hypothetical protein